MELGGVDGTPKTTSGLPRLLADLADLPGSPRAVALTPPTSADEVEAALQMRPDQLHRILGYGAALTLCGFNPYDDNGVIIRALISAYAWSTISIEARCPLCHLRCP